MYEYAKRMIPNYQNITEIPDGHLPKDLDPYGYEDNWSGAFEYCMRLTSLPDPFYNWNGVTNISHIFYYCDSLNCSIPKIPDSVINMNSAFMLCSNLTGNISNIPNSVTDMYSTFESCYNLTGSIPNIPNSVTNMSYAFSYCTNLTGNIPNIPNSVIDMSRAFDSCYNLTGNIPNIPNSVTNMSYAFYYCNNLKNSNVYIYGDNLNENRIARCFHNIPSTINIYCHANTTTYNSFANYVEETSSIGSNGPRYLYTFE